MANIATTTYHVTGTREAVNNLWSVLQDMKVNDHDLHLADLARRFGIDCEKKQISTRGYIYWADFEEGEKRDVLQFETASAWDACNQLFIEINHVLKDALSISWRVCEPCMDIFYTHDEGDVFPEECCVTSYGGPFEDVSNQVFGTVQDAIQEWISKMGIEQGSRSQDEMLAYINDFEYDNEDTCFQINRFIFE